MRKKRDTEALVTKGYLDQRLDFLEERIDGRARKYRDEVLTRFDDFAGKFEAMREDATIGSYQTGELREQVDDHEKRMKHLERANRT